jgi:RNA polymerase primary sigma factor
LTAEDKIKGARPISVKKPKVLSLINPNPLMTTGSFDRADFMIQLEKFSSSLLRRLAALYSVLSAEEERELALCGRNGCTDAHERIMLCNLRLVVSVARDYVRLGLPLDELVSEGTIGLIKAVFKHDPDNGARFAAYATWWVRHAILRVLCNQARLIRLPTHAVARMARIRQVFERMNEQLGRESTREESFESIGQELGLTAERVRQLQQQALEKLRRKLTGDNDSLTLLSSYLTAA